MWAGERKVTTRGKNLGTKPAKNNKRVLRYAVVPADRIFNWLAPMNVTCWGFFPELREHWWTPENVKIRKRIQELYIEKFDKFAGHFSRLEQSMLKDGFHAPVSTITGVPRGMYQNDEFPLKVLPPELRNNPNHVLCTHTFGGSRVIVAQKHNMDVPCLIYDYTNAFPEAETLKTQGQIKAKFNGAYSIGNINGVVPVRAITHTHLKGRNDGQERNNRHKVIDEIRRELQKTLAGAL